MLSPAMIAISELKLPMLKHSLATSIQYSITLMRCFFFTFYIVPKEFLDGKTIWVSGLFNWKEKECVTLYGRTYRAHLGGNEIAESVEPLDVRLEIASFLHVLERCLHIGILLSERLDKLFRSDERQSFQFNVCQLLRQHQRAGAHLRHVALLSVGKKEINIISGLDKQQKSQWNVNKHWVLGVPHWQCRWEQPKLRCWSFPRILRISPGPSAGGVNCAAFARRPGAATDQELRNAESAAGRAA